MKIMRSRYDMGKAINRPIARRGISLGNFPWKNPLKGDDRGLATAEVAMKGLGLFVGFRIKI